MGNNQVTVAATCARCGNLVSTTDQKMVRVHFAGVTDRRPCLLSYREVRYPFRHLGS